MPGEGAASAPRAFREPANLRNSSNSFHNNLRRILTKSWLTKFPIRALGASLRGGREEGDGLPPLTAAPAAGAAKMGGEHYILYIYIYIYIYICVYIYIYIYVCIIYIYIYICIYTYTYTYARTRTTN